MAGQTASSKRRREIMEPFHQRGHCFCRWLRSMSFCFLILRLYPVRTCGAKLLSPVAGSFMSIPSAPPPQIGGGSLQIDFAGTDPDLPKTCIIAKISKAAQAVATYYGRLPVSSARIQIVVATGEHGVLRGTTWGSKDGFPAVSRLIVGQHTTQQEFDADWIVTHELVHMALASLPDAQHWLEEGIATYVEPIVRSQSGQLGLERVWADMLSGMWHGEPEAFDRGLDRTHTWGRTYWGGALFCLVADVEIRRQTNNRYGLQDALRAIVAAGGTIDKDWPVVRVLRAGDKATSTPVLEELYSKWSETPFVLIFLCSGK